MQDSLWRSALRSLMVTCGILAGILLTFILFAFLFEAFSSQEEEISNDYSVKILANAEGKRKKLSKSAPVILQLDIQGVIGANELTKNKLETMLIESREDSLRNDRVKGILLVIDSPGGTIDDADGIFRAIKSYKSRYNVPVYAYVDGLCASGGVYIACAADQVFASDVSLIGSIGVITPPFVNVSKLMDKIGVDSLTISEGKGKDALNPMRPWKADEDKNIQEVIQYYYNTFVELVTAHRPKVDRDALIKDYGARVFPAEQAQKIGLIDGAGETRDSTLKKLLKKMSIEDDYYQVVTLESSSWVNQFLKADSPILTGRIKHEFLINGNLPAKVEHQPLYMYHP